MSGADLLTIRVKRGIIIEYRNLSKHILQVNDYDRNANDLQSQTF